MKNALLVLLLLPSLAFASDWFNVSKQLMVQDDVVVADMRNKQVIVVTEQHDQLAHHLKQIEVLKLLFTHRQNIVVGFEALPMDKQDTVDDWIDSKITDAEFLSEVEWDSYWGFDSKLYMPIFKFVKDHNMKLVGLGESTSIRNMMAAVGWQNIPEAHREGIPDFRVPKEEYVTELILSFNAFKQHTKNQTDPAVVRDMINRFITHQVARDVTMAYNIKKHLTGKNKVVAMVGFGHADKTTAVPYQLEGLGVNTKDVMTMWPMQTADDFKGVDPNYLDYGFFLK